MKITVCGKGGCGKSTVSALLAKEFERMGKTVLHAQPGGTFSFMGCFMYQYPKQICVVRNSFLYFC